MKRRAVLIRVLIAKVAQCLHPTALARNRVMDEHPLHCCTNEKPDPNSEVKLFFEDGPPRLGVWTGAEWQVARVRVKPVSWQPPYGREI